MDVSVQVSWPTLHPAHLLGSKPKDIDGLVIAGTVFPGQTLETSVRVVNLTDHDRTIKRGNLVLEAEPVEVVEDQKPPQNQSCKYLSKEQSMSGIPSHIQCICDKLKETLDGKQADIAMEFLRKNADVFSSHDLDLGRTNLVKHKIDTGDAKPVKQQLRRQPQAYLPTIDEEVEEMLRYDLIEPSSSPWASNIILVRKKGTDKLRFCVDFRKVNLATKKDSYPLPRIDACFDALGGAKYFSTLDLRQGFFQVELDEESRDKTTFVTRKGAFRFKVLPFGLSNSPSIFQRLMDLVLAGLT